jgi:uncharacterized SAM-binding protein YcdF (DUF218 family)
VRRRLVAIVLVAMAAVTAYVALTFVQVWMAARRDGARPADAIVVLGAAEYDGVPSPVLKARLDHALELYEADVAPIVVVTGGRRPGDRFTEASVGVDYLLDAGVPKAALRSEDEGTNTWESLAAAADVLRKEGHTDVVLVTSAYHALRAEHVAGEVGLHGHASPASLQRGLDNLGAMGRESIAVALGRVIGYDRLVDLDYRRPLGRDS